MILAVQNIGNLSTWKHLLQLIILNELENVIFPIYLIPLIMIHEFLNLYAYGPELSNIIKFNENNVGNWKFSLWMNKKSTLHTNVYVVGKW